jgi:hypothetical protein
MTSSSDEIPEGGDVDAIDVPLEGSVRVSDEEITGFVLAAKDLGPIKDERLGEEARHTSESGDRSKEAVTALEKTVVEELQEHLATADVHGQIRKFHVPPEYQEVFAGATIKNEKGWFVQTVDWFKKIIDRYSGGSFDPTTVDRDLIQLQAQMVYFSAWVNHLDGISTDAETTAKQAENRALIESRQWLDSHNASKTFNADMMRAIASESVQDRGEWSSTVKITALTVKGFYYALKDFIEYLDRVSQRAQSERLAARRHQ